MPSLEPDRNQLEIFVEALFRHCNGGGVVSLRTFFEDADASDPPARITTTSLKGGLNFLVDAAEDDARRAAQHPRAAVFCPPTCTFTSTAHAREIDLFEGPVLLVELDQNPRAALATLENLLGFATLVVRSGGTWTDPKTGTVEDKLHAYWRLKEPAHDKASLDKLKRLRRLATDLVGGDPSSIPINHPIRWAGSWHRKAAPRLCEIVSPTSQLDNELDLDVALAALEAVAPPGSGTGAGTGTGTGTQAGTGAGAQASRDWSEDFGKIIRGEEFHPILAPLASSFAAHALPQHTTRRVLDALLDNTVTTDPARLRRRDVEKGKLAATVRSAYDKFDAMPGSGTIFDPWQEFIVPPFPIDVLPGVVGEFVTKKSADIGVDVSGMAMSTLAACSGVIHHCSRINLKHHGTWWMHPNIWVLLVAQSSWKKTPAVDEAVEPIRQFQADIQHAYKAEKQVYEQEKKAGNKNAQEPEPPVRNMINNTTIEKLADLLSRTNRGILVVRDELAGWIGGMDKYNASGRDRSSDRAFWLESWNGGPQTYDRVLRGEIFIPNLSTSFLGGIQPKKLAQLQGLTDDGLLQRFVPILMQAPSAPADIDCKQAKEAYHTLIRELIKLPDQNLRVTPTAIDVMAELQQHLFKLEQVGGALPDGFEGFVGKLAGIAGALVIILHLINEPAKAVKNFVGGTVVENVRRLVMNFLLPHAYEFYCLQTGENDRLRKLAGYILLSGLERLRLADLTTNVRDCRGKSVREVNEKVSPLVAGGWLAPSDPGPLCRSWIVNRRGIDQQFATRMTSVRQSRGAFAQLIRARV
jgi:hypothetical protein